MHPFTLNELPGEIRGAIDGSFLESVSISNSGAQVLRVMRDGLAPRYLKIAAGQLGDDLRAERARLEWLGGRLPVPQVIACAEDSAHVYLLLTEVPGTMACDQAFASDVRRVVRALAAGLQQIHALDAADCAFDERTPTKLAIARHRLEVGLIDEEDIKGWGSQRDAAGLLGWLEERVPATEDLVFTHGDYCLPNVLLDPDTMEVRGFIDLGRCGVADRYHDLALAARSLAYNFGNRWEPLLREAYGLAQVDRDKLEYFRLLDRLY